MKIAVYSISLNEMLHVDRYMKACEGADYIIVADTGSIDGTPERLKELGATVHHISIKPWRFDMARDAALALVPADVDVCLILDMDEVPQKGFFDQVRKQWKEGAHFGWITMDTGSHWQKDRLHSRYGWHWKYPCHEVQVWYGEGQPVACDIKNAIISHLPDNNKSRGQYLPMLEMCVKEYPKDPRMWTYMTREYYFYQRWQEVIDSANKMLECENAWDVEQAAVCRWAGESAWHLGNKQEATEWFERSAKIMPKEGEPWYGIAIDAYRNNDWERCLNAAVNVLELPRSVHYCYEAAIWDWKAADLASISAYNLRHLDEAITFAKEAINGKGPETERIQRNLEFYLKVKDEITTQTHQPSS